MALTLSSCITVRFDMSDPDDRNKVVFYDVDGWVKLIINNPPIEKEYRNMEIKLDRTRIDWGKYDISRIKR
jgi:hypothetical protein